MGPAFVPAAIGGLVGGQASGALVARHLPATGPRAPLRGWGIDAGLGVVCALAMLVHRAAFERRRSSARPY